MDENFSQSIKDEAEEAFKKSITSRFLKVKDTLYNGSNRKMADSLDIHEATLSSILVGRKDITLHHIFALMQGNPDINIDWVLTGNGKMIRQKIDENLAEAYDAMKKERDRAYSIIDIWINTNKALYGDSMAAEHNTPYKK